MGVSPPGGGGRGTEEAWPNDLGRCYCFQSVIFPCHAFYLIISLWSAPYQMGYVRMLSFSILMTLQIEIL